MYKTRKYEVDETHPLYSYFNTICGNSKCLYNVTNYYVRNMMTGIQKDISKRTSNEKAVIQMVEQALPAYEQTVKIPAEIENCPVTQVGPRAFYHYIERIPPLRQSKWWDEFRSSTI